MDIDTMIAVLQQMRETHGNAPVVVFDTLNAVETRNIALTTGDGEFVVECAFND